MANFVEGTTLSSGGLLGTAVQWSTAAVTQQCLATPVVAEEAKVTPGDSATSDLLQQALNEVSFDADSGMSYMEHGGEVVYVQEDGKLVSLDGMIVSGDMAVMSVPQATGVVCADQHGVDVGRVLFKHKSTDAIYALMPSDSNIVNVSSSSMPTYSNSVESVYSANEVTTPQPECPVQISNVRSIANNQTAVKGQDNTDSVPSGAIETDSAALGTSRNPIRIIQRGNEYTAMQHLMPDQLTQIIRVIQEQQQVLQAKDPSSSSSAILYNPDAGSQVVYRITTSSDSAAGGGDSETVVRMISSADHGHQKRIVRKRKKDDDERVIGSEWSRQEKEERKKHRPRTRSGRVSKPPQYMVKDYKHIHPVDYDEDYDDSDGGYSDFKHSGDEDQQSKDDSLLDDDHSGWFML